MKAPTGVLLSLAFLSCHGAGQTESAKPSSSVTKLRIASVTPAPKQPQTTDKAVIFYDDFGQLPDWPTRYFEYSSEKGSFV